MNIYELIVSLLVQGSLVVIVNYLLQKGKNLATKEDIAEITRQVEGVRNDFKRDYDLSKTEKDLYVKLINSIESFFVEVRVYRLKTGKEINEKDVKSDGAVYKKYLAFIDDVNLTLSHMFVFLSDENYERFKNAIKVDEKQSLKDIRLKLLDALRQSLYPKTTHSANQDTRDFHYQ